MTHTVESLKQLVKSLVREEIYGDGVEILAAEAALSTALTEVLAELAEAYMNGYEGGKQEARDAAHEQIDTLQSKCDEAISALATTLLSNKELQSKIAAMESQEPVAYTVAGEVTNWARDFSKYKTQHYTRPVILAPGAAPKQTPSIFPPEVRARIQADLKPLSDMMNRNTGDGAAQKEPCVHKDVPSSCYRVRCQLGSKCVDDDMSFRAAPVAQKEQP